MKHTALFFLFFTLTLFGQNSNTTIADNRTIENNFSLQSIEAYQESAEFKIKDYYNYLEIYSDTTTSDSLKLQTKSAIYSLFESNSIEVIDVTANEKLTIPIEVLLEKLAKKNLKFQTTLSENTFLAQDYWITQYNLKVSDANKTYNLEVFNKVIFKPVQKVFGSKTKEVWTLFLGAME